MTEDLLALFRKTGSLLDGHFVLRSGLHSRQYFQCAILLQHTQIAADVCSRLADKLRTFECDAVISPALGGIIVGQEVGRSLGKKHIFVEKEEGALVLQLSGDAPEGGLCRKRIKLKSLLLEVASKSAPPPVRVAELSEGAGPLHELVW